MCVHGWDGEGKKGKGDLPRSGLKKHIGIFEVLCQWNKCALSDYPGRHSH